MIHAKILIHYWHSWGKQLIHREAHHHPAGLLRHSITRKIRVGVIPQSPVGVVLQLGGEVVNHMDWLLKQISAHIPSEDQAEFRMEEHFGRLQVGECNYGWAILPHGS